MVVEWYKNEVTLLVDKDNCFIEAVEPRSSWVSSLPYEVTESDCVFIA